MSYYFDSNQPDEVLSSAYQHFQEHGFVCLENVFDSAFIEKLQAHYQRHYAFQLWHTQQENKRPLYTLKVDSILATPQWFANPRVYPLVEKLLGQELIIAAMSVVVSFPGAPDQRLHRDAPPLFAKDYHQDLALPPYSVTMLAPLVDCTKETGCTRVWPGSHKISNNETLAAIKPIDPELKTGSVMLTDSRVLHLGAANHSQIHRPLLYITFHRHWFRDFDGYENRAPLNIDMKTFRALDPSSKQLFAWRFDAYKKWRQKEALFSLMPTAMRKLWNKLKGR